jgi:hypothetical protein
MLGVLRTRTRSSALIAGMVAGTLSIWTLSPLVWLWIGSQTQDGTTPSMGAIFLVVIGVILTTAAIGKGLAVLHSHYRDLHGGTSTVRIRLAWLESTRGARSHAKTPQLELSILDVILISSVFLAVGLYEAWFLFVSDSPIDFRTGRH